MGYPIQFNNEVPDFQRILNTRDNLCLKCLLSLKLRRYLLNLFVGRMTLLMCNVKAQFICLLPPNDRRK
jgi:hypothetical protein